MSDKARAALRQASRLDPTNKQAVEAFASLMARQGMLGASGEDVQAFYELDPTNPRAIQFKLQHAAATGDPRQVTTMLEELEAKQEHTDSELGLLYQANTLLQRHVAAERWAKALIDRSPDTRQHWMNLAAAQMRQGDEASMQQTLEQIAVKFADAPSAEQLTGELYIQDPAVRTRRRRARRASSSRDGSNTAARMELARAMASMGRFGSALDEIKKLLELKPDDIEVLALGSRIAGAADQRDTAEDYLSRIDPSDVDEEQDPLLAAQVYLNHGELDKAESICHTLDRRGLHLPDAPPRTRRRLSGEERTRTRAGNTSSRWYATSRTTHRPTPGSASSTHDRARQSRASKRSKASKPTTAHSPSSAQAALLPRRR